MLLDFRAEGITVTERLFCSANDAPDFKPSLRMLFLLSTMAQLQITIDDGPQPVRSALAPILAELRRRHQIKAAFFNLGQEVQADPAATRDILAAEHTLGNHSWDHMNPSTDNYSDEQIKDQFRRCHAAVQAATQVVMQHWRAPRNDFARLTPLLTQGPGHLYTLSHCDYHADSMDTQGANDAAGMLRAIRTSIAAQPNRTMFRLLFHVKDSTAAALRAVLDGLEQDHHTLVNFSQTA